MKKFSVVPALSLRPIQIVQREVIYFPFVVRKNVSELSKNLNIHCKSREISGPYNFLTPIKSGIPDVWNWNCWTLFGLENKVGERGRHDLLTPSQVATPLHMYMSYYKA